jgi:hypothetical protein
VGIFKGPPGTTRVEAAEIPAHAFTHHTLEVSICSAVVGGRDTVSAFYFTVVVKSGRQRNERQLRCKAIQSERQTVCRPAWSGGSVRRGLVPPNSPIIYGTRLVFLRVHH